MDEKRFTEAKEALREGNETLQRVATDIQRRVRENPWPAIGGVALTAFLFGMLMGKSRR